MRKAEQFQKAPKARKQFVPQPVNSANKAGYSIFNLSKPVKSVQLLDTQERVPEKSIATICGLFQSGRHFSHQKGRESARRNLQRKTFNDFEVRGFPIEIPVGAS